ncbi:MAG: hypothetical protein C0467_21815 [Planctomycetaceae bacterium]|nr:hypothetical protein [Planctomycetaceae bacterium]
MARMFFGVVALLASLSGCASSARYVEQGTESGVVAIPTNTDAWPSYNRTEAISLIQKHLGSNYEIVEEREVVTSRHTYQDRHANTEHVRDPNRIAASQPIDQKQDRPITHDITEWRIVYRKADAGEIGGKSTTGNIQQTQYQSGSAPTGVVHAGGIVPSVAPGGGVVPATGFSNDCKK